MLSFPEALALSSSKRVMLIIKVHFLGLAKNYMVAKLLHTGKKNTNSGHYESSFTLQAILMTLFASKASQVPFSTYFLAPDIKTPLPYCIFLFVVQCSGWSNLPSSGFYLISPLEVKCISRSDLYRFF